MPILLKHFNFFQGRSVGKFSYIFNLCITINDFRVGGGWGWLPPVILGLIVHPYLFSILTPAFYDSLCSSRHKRQTDDRDFKNVLQDPVYGLKVRCSFNDKTWCPCV